jgi:hypothetical protein
MSSIVIPAKILLDFDEISPDSEQNLKNSSEFHEFAGIRRNPVNPFLRHPIPSQICSFPTILGTKKIRKEREKKKKKKAGQISPDSDEFLPESLLMAF